MIATRAADHSNDISIPSLKTVSAFDSARAKPDASQSRAMRRRPGATAGHVARVNPEQPVDLIADGRIASVAVSDSALAPPALPHRIYSPRLTLRPHAS